MANNGRGRFVFVDQLPLPVREKFYQISNQSRTWYELAVKHKNYGHDAIRKLEASDNPTEDVLTECGFSNLTIVDLFNLLSTIPDFELMNVLKPFIDVQDHTILEKRKNDILMTLCPDGFNSSDKDLKIDSRNFNYSPPAQPGSPKVIIKRNDDESTIVKIINVSPSLADLPPSQNGRVVFRPMAGTSKMINQSIFSSDDNDLQTIAYEQLKKITETWCASYILGGGSFGTVFQGKWKGTSVAIRKIENLEADCPESFETQLQDLKILSSYKNHYILSLFAYGAGAGALCLVYELMIKGSLKDKLFTELSEPLTWLQRRVIAKGVSRGLHYLHTVNDVPLVHGNIKSSNILLDRNFEPRIGDLELPRICREKDNARETRMRKTRPYLPEEFLESKNLSPKMDIYCYGLVLFELATGLPEYDDTRPTIKYLKNFVHDLTPEHIGVIGDIKLEPETEDILENLISVGKWCTNGIPRNLPTMVEVLDRVNQF